MHTVLPSPGAPLATAAPGGGTLVGCFRLDRPLIAHVPATTDLEQSLIQNGRLVAASLPARVATDGPLVRGTAEAPEELTVGRQRYLGFTTPLCDPTGAELASLEVLVPLSIPAQLAGAALGDQRPVVHQADAVAVLGLVDVLGGDQQRRPARRPFAEVLPDAAA